MLKVKLGGQLPGSTPVPDSLRRHAAEHLAGLGGAAEAFDQIGDGGDKRLAHKQAIQAACIFDKHTRVYFQRRPKMHNGAMELHPAHHPKEIGRRIIMLRQLMGATNAAAFARSIGITPQALNNYERGVGRPEFLVALKLVQRCGVTLDWLYRGETSGLSAVMLNQIATHEQAESAPAPAAPAPSGTL